MKKKKKIPVFLSLAILLFSFLIQPLQLMAETKVEEPKNHKLSKIKKDQSTQLFLTNELSNQPNLKFSTNHQFVTNPQKIVVANETKELNQSGFVDDFELPQRTKRSEKDYITVNFSSKEAFQVQPGDTLSLELPSHLRGINAIEIPVVNDDGVQYGVMDIVGFNVKVTFNENVENYKELFGKLVIPISGEINVDEEGELFVTPEGQQYKELELTSNLGTDLAEKPYVVWDNIYEPGTGTAKMFSKTGGIKSDYNFDVVEYRIQVKAEEYDVVSDISLIDTLGEYQYFPDESEFITPYAMKFMEINYISKAGLEDKQMSIEEFEANGYGSFEFEDDRSFKMTFDKDKANGFLVDIYYRVKLTDIAKTVKPETVRNDVVETYHRVDQEEKVETDNVVVPVNYPDATARPAKGTLWIIKKKQIGDTSWGEQPLLPGVTFNIYKEDGSLVPGGENLVTDKNGRIELPDLVQGNYYAKEIRAPEGIEFDPDKHYDFTIDESAKYGIILAISNKAKRPKGEFTAQKEASKKILQPGETFTYKITVKNTVKDSLLKDLVVEDTMPEGIEIVGNLKLNGKEVGEILGDRFKVVIPELNGSQTAEVTIDVKAKTDAAEGEVTNIAKVTDPEDPEHPKEPEEKVTIVRETTLHLIKRAKEEDKYLSGAVFGLYQVTGSNKELISTHTSDEEGRINFEKLKTGTYEIKEITAPTGYDLLAESILVSINKYGEVTLEDTLSEMVELNKQDNQFELLVKNKEKAPGGVLPQTGGSGTNRFITIASFWMLLTLVLGSYYIYRSRKGWH